MTVIPLPSGVFIDGADEPHILEGEGARKLFSQLLPLMDGSRTTQQIRQELPGVPATDLHAALSDLLRWGLVEDAETSRDNMVANPEAVAFFSRFFGRHGTHASGREVYEALQTFEIILANTREGSCHINTLRSLLVQSGVGKVTILESEHLLQSKDTLPARSLVISCCFEEEDRSWHGSLDAWCKTHERSWLRAVLSEKKGHADLGPLFHPANACYHCFYDFHCSSRGAAPFADDSNRDTNAQFLIGLLAIEAIYLLSDASPSLIEREVQRYELPEWNAGSLRWARKPGCPHCRPLDLPRNHLPEQAFIDTAIIFEDHLGLPSRPRSSAARELSQSIIDLPRQMTRLTNCRQIALERAIPELPSSVLEVREKKGPRQSLAIADLAILLMMTAGLRSQRSGNLEISRWAATAGNLGSVEVFVVVREVSEMEPGVYFYQAADHSLARFQSRRKTLDVNDFMHRILAVQAESLPLALVLFTGAFHRVEQKYGTFGYRLLNFDAGVAMSQLHMVANARNICSTTVSRWPDDLIEQQLNLFPMQQHCTGIVALSATNWRKTDAGAAPLRKGLPRSTKPIQHFVELPTRQVFEMLLRESRVSEHELGYTPWEIPGELQNVHKEGQTLAALSSRHTGGMSVGEVLAHRKSIRHYAANPVSLNHVGCMLQYACQGDRTDWPEEHAAGQDLTFLAVAARIEGLSPGVYSYMQEVHALEFSGPGPTVREGVELYVQAEFSSAPLAVWITGNLAAACARHGAFGHRQLLLRAGAAANRLWMAALGMGLEGCIVAGLVSGAARRWLGLDGYQRASLIAFSTGHSPGQSAARDWR
jgi:SagB-type dehydrogenase family enzyme